MKKRIMSWSKCQIEIGTTGDGDTFATSVESIGTIKDKSSSLEATDGDVLEAKATGGETVAKEQLEGGYSLTTRVIEPDDELLQRLGLGNIDAEELKVQTHVVEGDWSVKVTPKNIGAKGIKAPKCSITYKPGWSEEEGDFADLTFEILKGDAGYWYSKFRKKGSLVVDVASLSFTNAAEVQSRHAKGQTPVIQEENGYQPFGERKEATPPKEEPLKEEPSQLGLFDGKLLSKEAALQHMILGQLFDTYWLVQYGDKLYIIDQHAAHEKVLYERLMRDLKKHAAQSQLLSPPIVLPMSMQEERLYLKYQQYFADMGFEIEAFGDRTYAARAVPSHLPGIANSDLFMELLDSLSDLSGSASSETLQDKIASMSCKAAVKGKRRLSSLEAKALIDELLTLENPYHCPHGRPTIISMSKYELEKKFKRIV